MKKILIYEKTIPFAQSKISEIQNDGHYKLVKVEDE